MLITILYNLKSKQFNTLNQLRALESSSQVSMHLEYRPEIQMLIRQPCNNLPDDSMYSSLVQDSILISSLLEEIYCVSLQ